MSESYLELTRESHPAGTGELAVVKVTGELDLSNAEELTAAMAREALEAGLIVDLAELSFMDSSGLRVLMLAASDRGARLALVAEPDSPVRRVLDLAGLTDRIATFPARGAAADAVEQAGE